MAMLREFMLGLVGTVRFYPGWTGQNVQEVDNIQINFNRMFWSVKSFGT